MISPSASVFRRYKNVFGSALELVLLKASIVDVRNVDALVNSTGSHFEHSSGVARAITTAAGSHIVTSYDNYLAVNGPLDYGHVAVTGAFNMARDNGLKHILHVRSPVHNTSSTNDPRRSILFVAYKRLLEKAFAELGVDSLATPLVATGLNGVPVAECFGDLMSALDEFVATSRSLGRRRPCVLYVVNMSADTLRECELVIHHKFPHIVAIAAIATPSTSRATTTSTSRSSLDQDGDEICAICMERMHASNVDVGARPKWLAKCGHAFCTRCIDYYFEHVKQVCPRCNMVSFALPYLHIKITLSCHK